MKKITVNPSVCTGCRACEMACSFEHTDKFSSDLARIHVAKDEQQGLDVPFLCRMCAEPECVSSCPTGALSRTECGIIAVDEGSCIGCGLCADACPHGAVVYHPEESFPLICDLCQGSPACVDRCVSGALRYEEPGKSLSRRRQSLARKQARQVFACWNADAADGSKKEESQ